MDLFDKAFLDFWRCLNDEGVRYILVGGLATNLHGYQRCTGDVDIYLEDTLENRQKLRAAYRRYGIGDFESFERMQFVRAWVDFPLQNGIKLDIMTSLNGVNASFQECLRIAPLFEL